MRMKAKTHYGVITSRERERETKVKFTLEQATKAQRGSRGKALLFL